jgi:hypothetical protein
VQHLGVALDVPNAEGRRIRLVGHPFTLSCTPSKMAARPQEFGEQTDEDGYLSGRSRPAFRFAKRLTERDRSVLQRCLSVAESLRKKRKDQRRVVRSILIRDNA